MMLADLFVLVLFILLAGTLLFVALALMLEVGGEPTGTLADKDCLPRTTDETDSFIESDAVVSAQTASQTEAPSTEAAPLPGNTLSFEHLVFTAALWFLLMVVTQYGVLHATAKIDEVRAGRLPLRELMLATTLWHATTVIVLLSFFRYFAGVPRAALGLNDPRWRQNAWVGLRQLGLWLPVTLLLSNAIRSLWPPDAKHPALELMEQATLFDTLVVAIAVTLAAPIAEELLFRGVLQTWACRTFGSVWGLFVAAGSFGFMHGNWPDPLPLAVLGLGLGLAYQKTGSLWSSIALHAGFNGFMIAALLFTSLFTPLPQDPEEQEEPREMQLVQRYEEQTRWT